MSSQTRLLLLLLLLLCLKGCPRRKPRFCFLTSRLFSASREISKPLIPLGKAGVLLVQILILLCKEMV